MRTIPQTVEKQRQRENYKIIVSEKMTYCIQQLFEWVHLLRNQGGQKAGKQHFKGLTGKKQKKKPVN